jgi:hypothetical protein
MTLDARIPLKARNRPAHLRSGSRYEAVACSGVHGTSRKLRGRTAPKQIRKGAIRVPSENAGLHRAKLNERLG